MPESSQLLSALVWLLVVLGILLLAFFAYRALTGTVRGRRGMRLGISEYHEIDKTRRLVLVRRDNVEHLVLIGGAQELLIESNIPAASPAPTMQREAPSRGAPVARPAAFAERKPAPRPLDANPSPGGLGKP